jgi:hypothetical protein
MPKNSTKGYTPPSNVSVEKAESPKERSQSLDERQITLKQLIQQLQTIAKEAGEDVPCWTIEFGGLTRLYDVEYEKGTGVVFGSMY